jgi:hypothetical protein
MNQIPTRALRAARDGAEALAGDELLRHRFAVQLLQLRLPVEQVDVRGSAVLEQIDYVLRLRQMVRQTRQAGAARAGGRRFRGHVGAAEEPRQCGRADAGGAAAEEFAARDVQTVFEQRVHGSLLHQRFVEVEDRGTEGRVGGVLHRVELLVALRLADA